MKSFKIIFIIFLFYSCQEKLPSREGEIWKSYGINDFPVPKKLTGTPMEIKGKMMRPRKLHIEGDFLMVSDKAMNPPIHVFNRKEENYAFGLGIEGVGPGEITYVWTFDYGHRPNEFWTYSVEDKIFSLFDLTDSTKKASSHQIRQRNPEFYLAVDIAWATDSTLIALRADGIEKFVEYDTAGNVVRSYGSWEGMLAEDVPLNVTKDAFAKHFATNKSKSKFGFFSMDRDHFEILDIHSQKILVVEGPFMHKPEFEIGYHSNNSPYYFIRDDNERTYQDLFLGEEHIYLLYSGIKRSKIVKAGLSLADKIFMFDYEGNILNVYHLDQTVGYITVDEENGIIYALSAEEDADIIKFHIQ
ncbi:hypothetical protein BH23BAC2_BH23BAC2_27110 [soil metagenome]